MTTALSSSQTLAKTLAALKKLAASTLVPAAAMAKDMYVSLDIYRL
ncbi:hypothetical protein N8500_04430 [Candidatus Puniceispirillum sp.]|nr:hypothetical protein [Candidatus Puniceispirillum sp.]